MFHNHIAQLAILFFYIFLIFNFLGRSLEDKSVNNQSKKVKILNVKIQLANDTAMILKQVSFIFRCVEHMTFSKQFIGHNGKYCSWSGYARKGNCVH